MRDWNPLASRARERGQSSRAVPGKTVFVICTWEPGCM